MRLPLRTLISFGTSLGVILPVLAFPSLVNAQNYSDLPPLAPMSEAEVRTLPPEYRAAPAITQTTETVTTADGVETITRTRRIDYPHSAPAGPHRRVVEQRMIHHGAMPMGYAPTYAPVVFEREQWIDECRRRTAGRDKDDTGLIIGGLLGAIAGGVAGYEIAGAGDRVLGTVLGVGGGGLIGGLIGNLFDGDDDEDRYDCEAALDNYLAQHGTRVASREIAYPAPAYGYPAMYGHGYAYAPPQQMVLVPVRTEVQQQVVVRETVREESYFVPGTVRVIPAPPTPPSPKMIKGSR